MKRVLVVAAATLFAIALSAGAQQQGVTSDTVTIGAHGPITGPAAYIGLAGRDGMLLAIKEINTAGGVNGRKIVAVFEDDGHSPTKALAAVKKLVEQDKVFAVMSVGGSNATVGAVDYMKENGVPYYVSIASAPQVTWPHARNLFRGGTTETARYGELYAEFLATYYKAKRIAIISGREEYPRNEGDATVDKLKSWFQMAPAVRVEFNIGDKDFTPQLVDVQKSNPDVIAFFGNPAEAAIAMRQAKELGLKQPFFVGSNMVDPGLVTAAKSSAEGVMGFSLIPYLPGSKASDMVKWEAAWKKEYPSAPAGRPNNFDLLAYGDMYVLAEAMKRAGPTLTTDRLIGALEGIQNYRVGPVATPRTFSTKHHIGNLALVPMMVKDGQWEPVQWSSTRQSDILNRYQ
jgi:branched-chain amino acid transport system substrate-binding protein